MFVLAYSHVKNGRAVIGLMEAHIKCSARLSVFVPLDAHDRRAIVIPGTEPHNHPIHLQAKVPYAARKKYQDCVEASGVIGMTPLRIDRGAVTRWH